MASLSMTGRFSSRIELWREKSGGELLGQLFDFMDKGGASHVAMRPEMTPTLARMVATREKDFKKPLKWFCCPQFFRIRKQQRGRRLRVLPTQCGYHRRVFLRPLTPR